jgi:YHS domain-containing protein
LAKKPAEKRSGAKKPAKAGGSGVVCACCPDWPIKYPERCSNTVKHAGTTYYFCTKRCKDKFQRHPSAYVR